MFCLEENKKASAQLFNLVKRGDKGTSERFVSCSASDQAIIYFNKASRFSGTQSLFGIWSKLMKNHVFAVILLKTRLKDLPFCAPK